MSAFNGKWQLCSSENFQEYMEAIGVSPSNAEKAKTALGVNSKLTLDINAQSDSWTIKTITPLGEKEVKFTLGVEFETATLDGRPVKVVNTLDGDRLVEVQKGDGFESRNQRVINGSEMIATMCGGGVTVTRKYKRI